MKMQRQVVEVFASHAAVVVHILYAKPSARTTGLKVKCWPGEACK